MVVDMDIDMSDLKVESNRAVLFTPLFVNGTDTLSLSSIGVYGRRRYFYYVRNGESMLSGARRDDLPFVRETGEGRLSCHVPVCGVDERRFAAHAP